MRAAVKRTQCKMRVRRVYINTLVSVVVPTMQYAALFNPLTLNLQVDNLQLREVRRRASVNSSDLAVQRGSLVADPDVVAEFLGPHDLFIETSNHALYTLPIGD